MPLSSTVRSLVIAVCMLVAATALAGQLDALKNTTPAERAAAQTMMMKTKLGRRTTSLEAPCPQSQVRRTDAADHRRHRRAVDEDARRPQRGGAKGSEAERLALPDQFQKFQTMKEEMGEHLMDQIQQQRNAGS